MFKFVTKGTQEKELTMFICSECGEEKNPCDYWGTAIGTMAKICSDCVGASCTLSPKELELKHVLERQFARREGVALEVLKANFSNPAMNFPNSVLSVASLISASFRIADEFLLYSEASWDTEMRKSLPSKQAK
jgi:hypothetical protein